MAKTKLKGSTLVWWNMMQEEREQIGRKKINSWERMKIIIKTQFLPLDYEVQIHKMLMSLKQREMDVSAYTEEFNKLTLRARKQEEEVEKVARYLNGLRQNIQDEINMLTPEIIHKCFQLSLREEDKIKRKSEFNQRGRGGKGFRGRGTFGRGHNFGKNEEGNQIENSGDNFSKNGQFRGNSRGRNRFRGRFGTQGRGPTLSTGKCFHCHQVGHTMNQCPEKTSSSYVGERRTQLVQEEDNQSVTSPISKSGPVLDGENLMLRRTLLKVL